MKTTIKITIILFFSTLSIFAQSKEDKKVKIADTFYEELSYIKASEVYKELAKTNPTEHVLKRLGDCYYNNVFMKKASKAYKNLFDNYTSVDPEYMFKYAQTLRATGNFEESKLWMKKFNAAKSNDSRGKNFTRTSSVLSDIKDNKYDYIVTNLKSINTSFSDFGVTDYGNTIVFSSPRERSVFVKRSHSRNDKNFLDLYKVIKEKISSEEGVDSNVKPVFTHRVNTKFHESSVTFSPDRKTMYFTRNNYVKGKYKNDKQGYNNLKILKAKWIDKKWQDIEEVSFNSDEYSVGHPSISKDGKKLYFTSDMPGGIGKTDIYVVDIKDDGSFSLPQNLGPTINTEGREMFPFIAGDDILYFSSDGHFGIGALDIFGSQIEKGEFTKPINLKAPVNSKLDDFAFSINTETKTGYLSSNREGGLGDDDIYSIERIIKPEPPKPPCMQMVTGIVRDKKFKNPLAGSRLVLKDNFGTVLKDTIVGASGKFNFTLPCNKKFTVFASKEYYKSDQDSFETTTAAEVALDLDFTLEIANEFTYNERNELVIKINPIYFDYNKSNIRPDAAIQLNIVAAVMNKYPKIEVRGSSHTDARGKAHYNEKLSSRRATSTVKYVISQGVSPNRLTAKGFGETQLTNNCVDNDRHTNRVKCTKEQHQANRRTEFVIIKM